MLRGISTPEEYMITPVASVEGLNDRLALGNPEAPFLPGDVLRSAYIDETGNQVHSFVKVGLGSIQRVFNVNNKDK